MNSDQCVSVDVVSQDESRREKEWSNMSLQAAAALMSNLCLDKTQCLHNNLPSLPPPHMYLVRAIDLLLQYRIKKVMKISLVYFSGDIH